MDALIQDIRFAVRQLVKSPGFTLVAVLTLAIGIGATTAVYSLANWVLLRPIPGANDDGQLLAVTFASTRRSGPSYISYPDYRAFQEQVTAFSGLAAEMGTRSLPIARVGQTPRREPASDVTGNYFEVLGVRPRLGRLLDAQDLERGARPVVVISHRLWTGMFGGDPGIIAHLIRVSGKDRTIVGVAPRDFRGVDRVVQADLWMPISPMGEMFSDVDAYALTFESRRRSLFGELIGRLKPGASAELARTQLQTVIAQTMREFPAESFQFREATAEVRRGVGIPAARREQMTSILRVLAWVSGILIVIAVANVANLVLFRGVRRRGELALRAALGATAGRLARQGLLEGLSLALLAGVTALVFAGVLASVFRGLKLPGLARIDQIGLDGRVMGFGLGMAVLTGLLVGIAPGIAGRAGRFGIALRETSPGGSRRYRYARSGIAVLQLAAGLTLLVGALLLVGTLRNLRSVDLGFDPHGLNVFALDVQGAEYSDSLAAPLRDEAVRQIRAIAGVEDVAATWQTPFSGFGGTWPIFVDLADPYANRLFVTTMYVPSNYFALVRIPILKGRGLPDVNALSSEADKDATVISESAARYLYGAADPIGRHFYIPSGPSSLRDMMKGTAVELPPHAFTVVGVVPDSRWGTVVGTERGGTLVYRALNRVGANTPTAANGISVLVRSAVPIERLRPQVESIVASLAPTVQVTGSRMIDNVDASLSEQRLFAKVVGLLTVLAVVLAGVGLYALVAFSVAQRTREFGIRMALGARAREILDLVVWQGTGVAAVGVVLGLGGAGALSRVLSNRLFGVTPLEPYVYLLAVALLVLLVLIASLVPARAATKVDPMVALRTE